MLLKDGEELTSSVKNGVLLGVKGGKEYLATTKK
jgi:hypothetical protein